MARAPPLSPAELGIARMEGISVARGQPRPRPAEQEIRPCVSNTTHYAQAEGRVAIKHYLFQEDTERIFVSPAKHYRMFICNFIDIRQLDFSNVTPPILPDLY